MIAEGSCPSPREREKERECKEERETVGKEIEAEMTKRGRLGGRPRSHCR